MTVIEFIQKILNAGVTGNEEIVVRNGLDKELLDDIFDVVAVSDEDDDIQVVITLDE